MKTLRKILINIPVGIIRIYQWTLSPLLGRNCRFDPSCSQYSIEAFKKYGIIKGFYLTVKRISRCNPWGGHGYDPLP